MEKGSSEFERDFVAGTFERLDVFAQNRRISWDDEAELVKHIKVTYPSYRVVVKKDGTVCIIRLYRGSRAQG